MCACNAYICTTSERLVLMGKLVIKDYAHIIAIMVRTVQSCGMWDKSQSLGNNIKHIYDEKHIIERQALSVI